ncbi:MAG: TIGR03862 family flavoprotein [Verrucomicrobia bacterium]|nr:TIGR03862 family flavoprotein [Verrucomicrobiota bacterium]
MNLAIIGGGPAGLMAAEVASVVIAKGASREDLKVTLFEGKPSVGRKFLVAGHGGLNLTHSDPLDRFAEKYQGSIETRYWTSLLKDFSNQDTRDWATGLGIETFIGTSGRIFPKEFKAAPLLRSWIQRLRTSGVKFAARHYLQNILPKDGRIELEFSHPEGVSSSIFDAVILALGGASWPKTGSDAQWIPILQDLGISIAALEAANCGWETSWHPDIIQLPEGQPLKNIAVSAGNKTIQGELMITAYGLEGGAIYQLGHSLRSMPHPLIFIDLKPTFSVQELQQKLSSYSGNIISAAKNAWRLGKAAHVLINNLAPEESRNDPLALARFAKAIPIPLTGPRPIAEAISSAGGIRYSELNDDLMIKKHPGLFVAGEMIDWEAPTGGYLLQGCLATGTRAARGALRYLNSETRPVSAGSLSV